MTTPASSKAAAAPTAATPAANAAKAPARKPSGTALNTLSDIVRCMYYGDPGKGKTTAMAGMARLGKVKFFDAERRLKPGPLRRLGIPIENIQVFNVTTYEQMLKDIETIANEIEDGEPIVGVCWDSATETARILLENLVNTAASRAQRAGKDRDPWKTFQEDYGDLTEQMRRIIRRLRDLEVHLAITCLAKRDNDEEGAVRISPALTPAVQRDFLGYMDVVGHARLEFVDEQEEYSILTRPIGRFEAKDSFGILPRTLVNPSFDRIVAYVNGELAASKDPVQQAAKAARQKSADAAPAAAAD